MLSTDSCWWAVFSITEVGMVPAYLMGVNIYKLDLKLLIVLKKK